MPDSSEPIEPYLCETCGHVVLLFEVDGRMWIRCTGCGTETTELGSAIVEAIEQGRAERAADA